MAHDHSADVADAVAGRCQRVTQMALVVIDIARERIPGGFRPVFLGVLGAAGIEEDRPSPRVLDDRRDNRGPAALVGRMRAGTTGTPGTCNVTRAADPSVMNGDPRGARMPTDADGSFVMSARSLASGPGRPDRNVRFP